jgi:phosphohistidine phosphatase
MKLYLVRHGEALAEDIDPTRPLSEKGKKEVLKIASFLKEKNIKIPLIWHSPKKRAEQSAELIAGEIGCLKMIPKNNLVPNGSAEVTSAEIKQTDLDLMIVSHLPLLAEVASLLLGAKKEDSLINFSAGSLAVLESTSEDRWSLKTLVCPEDL